MRILLLLLGVYLVHGEELHQGYQVLRLTPHDVDQAGFIHQLMEQETEMGLDFWTEPKVPGHPVDISIPPSELDHLKNMFDEHDIQYSVMIEDLAKKIEEHMLDNKQRQGRQIYDAYLSYDEMMAWVDTKGEECGSRCTVESIGTSFEDRDLKVIKITDGSGENKPIAWIDSGIHAREWISYAVNLYFIERMIDDFSSDAQVQAMLGTYDWYFMPCINPDGYVYTHTDNRMWRKTRRPNSGSSCVGCDANRNFDHNFGGIGTSSDPCSETYHGNSAYSQPETLAVSNYITALPSVPDIFVTMHSYSQLWMAPWGYTTARPPNYDDLMRAGTAAINALRAVHGTNYQVGSASEILYASSGTSRDWAYGIPEIYWVYTIELRDTGSHGFILPPEQIRPSQEETWAAIQAMYDAIQA